MKDNTENQYAPISLGIRKSDYPTRIITEEFGQYEAGVLFAQNIKYNGLAVPVDIARDLFDTYIEIGQITGLKINGSLNNGKIALLEVDINDKLLDEDDIELYEELQVGEIYSVSILYSTMSFYILSIEDTHLRGYIEKEVFGEDFDVSEEIELQLSRKTTNPLQLSHFVIPAAEEEETTDQKSVVEDLTIRESSFLTQEEWAVLPSKDTVLLKQMLTEYPTLSKETKTEIVQFDVLCRYGDKQPSKDLESFIGKYPHYFEDGAFWVNTFDKDGKTKLVFFDENSTVIVIDVLNKEFAIDQFYAEKKTPTANLIIKRNKEILKIPRNKLRFLSRTEAMPHDYDAEKVVLYISRLNDLNSQIFPEIRKSIGSKIKEDAVEYRILQNFLKFEKETAENDNGEPLFIDSDKISYTPGRYIGDATALTLKISESQYQQLIGSAQSSNQSDDELHISVLDNNDNPIFSGKLSFTENNEYALSFFESRDLSDFKSNGIKIIKRTNTQHLDVQLKALKGFVKRDSLSIHKNLVFDNIEIPDISKYDTIEFYNKSIAKAEKDNRQAEAVKKALGNKNIVLIQGPPGTGKTTVIVEIIRQLAKEGKKVLVCSQAHAAVDNIYRRLPASIHNKHTLKVLRINNEGKTESWGENFDGKDYETFIVNNERILQKLLSGEPIEIIKKDIAEITEYSDVNKKKYLGTHRSLCDYYPKINDIEKKDELKQILESLQKEANALTGLALETQRYQSMDVILGTCIGVGMNNILKRNNSIKFDTVIIDEAAKANLAETIVPLRLGKRFVLVGDHNQLPPYIDRERINTFDEQRDEEDDNAEFRASDKDVVKALSTSLFEDFYNHSNFPEENNILLNYQYRMHPEIGNFISKLFYDSKLKNGVGTEKEYVHIPNYPNPVIFFDTSNQKETSYEEREQNGSYFNLKEIEIICNSIIPKILPLLTENPELKVGIISPYSAHCQRLRRQIDNKNLRDSVYTIDSIQGSEFDVVIFSFVRSFPKKSNHSIGFLSDLRRLNVSLSRAKKKLILVGNKDTLVNPSAHKGTTNTHNITTLDVFKAITENIESMFDVSSVDYFRQNCPKEGFVFNNCTWEYEKNNSIVITIKLKDRNLTFRMPFTFNPSKHNIEHGQPIDVVFKGLNQKNGKPNFEYYDNSFDLFAENHSERDIIENVQVKEIIRDGIILNYNGVDGLLPSRYINDANKDCFSKNNKVTVRIEQIKKDKKKVYCIPVMRTAEEVEQRFIRKFEAKVIMINNQDVQLKFADGSQTIIQMQQAMISYLLDEGKDYTFFIAGEKIMLDRTKEYYHFLDTHDALNGVYKGMVEKEDETNFYVLVDGFYCQIIKNDFTKRKMQVGRAYHFSIYNTNDKNKSIQLKLEK